MGRNRQEPAHDKAFDGSILLVQIVSHLFLIFHVFVRGICNMSQRTRKPGWIFMVRHTPQCSKFPWHTERLSGHY